MLFSLLVKQPISSQLNQPQDSLNSVVLKTATSLGHYIIPAVLRLVQLDIILPHVIGGTSLSKADQCYRVSLLLLQPQSLDTLAYSAGN